jgi:hypothetical protein
VFGLAVALRVLVTVAYRPAFEFNGDSYGYLHVAQYFQMSTWHPPGYSVLLRLLSLTESLLAVPVVQHVMGLVTGVLVYRFVRQRGGSDGWSALAAAPILLDAWSVSIEHGLITEPLFDLLLVGALTLITRPRIEARSAATACLLISAAVWVRTTGLVVAAVVLLYVLLRRPGPRACLAAGIALTLPVAGYFLAFHAANGSWGPDQFSGRYLYGETATFADCSLLRGQDRVICPSVPPAHRGSPTSYVWGSGTPLLLLRPVREDGVNTAGRHFGLAVIRAQPWDYARFVASTTLHYFAAGRQTGVRDYPVQTWQFPWTSHPPPVWSLTVAEESYDAKPAHPVTVTSVATALRGYQRVGFTPGPALAIAVLVALAGIWLSRHHRRAMLDLLLLTGLGVGLLVLTSATSGAAFDYRYLLTSLVLLPPAGVLGMMRVHQALIPKKSLVAHGIVAVAVVGSLASNVMTFRSNVTPVAQQRASAVHALGTPVTLPGGPTIELSAPQFRALECSRLTAWTAPTVQWFIRASVRVRNARSPRLVRADNFSTEPTFWATGRSGARASVWLADTVLDSSRPAERGLITLRLGSPPDTVSYTDPTGHGAASWHLSVDAPVGAPLPGAPCTLPTPSYVAP